MLKYIRYTAFAFFLLNLAVAVYDLGNALLMLPFRSRLIPQLYFGGLLSAIVAVGWWGFLKKRIWASYVLLAALAASMIFPSTIILTSPNNMELLLRMMLTMIQIAVLIGALLPHVVPIRVPGKALVTLRRRTRVAAWIYIILSIYTFGVFLLFSMARKPGGHTYINIWLQMLPFATQWIFWIMLLRRHAWAWWVLTIEYAGTVLWLLWSFTHWIISGHHYPQAALHHHAVRPIWGAVFLLTYLVLYILPLWILLTDSPSAWRTTDEVPGMGEES